MDTIQLRSSTNIVSKLSRGPLVRSLRNQTDRGAQPRAIASGGPSDPGTAHPAIPCARHRRLAKGRGSVGWHSCRTGAGPGR